MRQRYRTLRYGMFVAGLLVAAVSFLMCFGNALAGEGRSDSVEKAAILGVMAGSIIAGVGIITGAVMSRRFVPLAAVIVGGLGGAAGGWLLGSLLFGGGTAELEWKVAVCLTPIGMWLGLLAGGQGGRVASDCSA